MSREALEAVIGRAVIDEEFRLALFADPDSALAGYALTDGELAALRDAGRREPRRLRRGPRQPRYQNARSRSSNRLRRNNENLSVSCSRVRPCTRRTCRMRRSRGRTSAADAAARASSDCRASRASCDAPPSQPPQRVPRSRIRSGWRTRSWRL